MEGYVQTEVQNNIGAITFFHPKGNSLPGYLLSQMEKAVQELSEADNAKIILLKSDGKGAFCAGASFDELANLKDYEQAKAFFSGFGKVINAIRKSPKLVVCRVHGKIVGGGVGLVSACDYVVAIQDASVRLSEFSIAIGPFVISHAVERKIGKSAFMQLTIDTDWYNAQWCYEKGLFNRLFDTIEEMDSFLDTFLKKLAERSSKTQSELKRLFWEGTENWDAMLEAKAEITATLALDQSAREIINSLLKKG